VTAGCGFGDSFLMFRPGPPRDRIELPQRFRAGGIDVDLDGLRVVSGGRRLELEPKAFDLLLLLAGNPGRVVEKEEIFERIWPDSVVTDNALARVVAHLRRELGDSAEQARYVETVRTRGYRFLPEIEPVARPAAAPAATPESGPAPAASERTNERGGWTPVALALAAAALLGWLWLRSRPAAPAVAAAWRPQPVQRTVETGYRGGADFSPDGSQMVYSSDAAGGLQLFVRAVEGGRELQITEGGGPKIDAAWSPDGRWIAYRDMAAGGLWLVAPTGGAPRQLLEFGSQPAWFPDGQRLAFSHPGRGTLGSFEWPATYSSKLWTVELATGVPRPLVEHDAETGGQGMPAVSPDGAWVYYATGRIIGGGELWRVSSAGGEPERLAGPPTVRTGYWLDPTPTPDGTAVLAVSTALDQEIVRFPIGNGWKPQPLLAPAPPGTSQLAVSADGRRLVYTELRNRPSVEEAEVGGDSPGPPRTLLAPSTSRVTVPLYSPDGQRIALVVRRGGAPSQLMVFERASGELRQLPGGGDLRDLGASTRVQTFVWLSPTRLRQGSLNAGGFDYDLTTGLRRPFTPPAGAAALLARAIPRPLSVDFARGFMVFTAAGEGGSQELFIGDLATGRAVQRTRMGRAVDYPTIARDGRIIAFQVAAGDGGANEIWRLMLEDGEPVRLPTGEGASWCGLRGFSADGDALVYAALRGGAWHMAIAGVGMPERLLDVPPETVGYLRWPDWSPDGRHVVYERMHYEANLWTIDLPPAR
jgi:Tol biopolymer transport system component/DNA-binding winged helix-turn-helix (wHTH) protein